MALSPVGLGECVAFASWLQPAELHSAGRAGWLRAAVLGANDGLVSTSSLMVGVAASGASGGAVVTAGIAGIAAGAMAMAAGEYVSVSSQRDVEDADRAREEREHALHPEAERRELVGIYEGRGLPHELAEQVADAFHAVDPLGAHLRDELGQFEHNRARPLQAAAASAACFTVGGLIPFIGLVAGSTALRLALIVVATVAGLVVAGVLGARIAGGGLLRPTLRVVVGGSAAMVVTAVVGQLAHLSGV